MAAAMRLLLPLLATLLLANMGYAAEEILHYHSDIAVGATGELTVTETIQVRAQGQKIKRGIYRDFPTRYVDANGNTIKVPFKVRAVTRDGNAEDWHTKQLANGIRVYIGSADTSLAPGIYTYSLTYFTDRQVGFFDKYDELYWNVTGNGWDFAIANASASVQLPAQVSIAELSIEGFTGPQGAQGKHFHTRLALGAGHIETTAALGPREGLTLVFTWPKGVVQPPGFWKTFWYQLRANLGTVLSLLALLGSALYLLVAWYRHGRDPRPGVIFPHYEAPAGFSPASARYINRMGYDNKTFAAAIINLAVKGHVHIDCTGRKDYVLKRLHCESELAPGEAAMINKLFNTGNVLELDNENHAQISAARAAHEASLKADYLNRYFKTNAKLLWPSVLVCALLLFIILVTASFHPMVLGCFTGVVLLHVLFIYLMKVPLSRGRKLMDQLAGFKLYLEVAEKDELNMRNPPELTPQLFEQYLPFAIALGVEQEWSEQFSAVFDRLQAETGGQGYHPRWYSGDFSSNRMAAFSSNVGSGFSSAISSASTAPGSSSGSGGGGFSGGGGGGGGGGGW